MNLNLPALHALKPYLLASMLGALAVLGFAPFYIFPAPIIALVGLIMLWAKTESAKTRFQLGFCFGLGLYCVGIYWIYISLHTFGGMPCGLRAFARFVYARLWHCFLLWLVGLQQDLAV